MRRGRPIPELILNSEEQETLQRWARRPTSAQALALRARVILACATGKTHSQVSAEMQLSKPAVGKWRSRFVPGVWTDCWMNRARVHPVRSVTPRWSVC